ncbi:hypothetical protein [Flavobacterium tistrianum]|uniref:hypothetical protein n=1 Tax=Flavobacterium tistrianum TaxID=1685414 RepID=UPI000DAD365A|nr:hypothetical protein [Flavobacterium tistrianum]KAF2339781.1 hypothetical protein DMB71_15045 [Flavobacterium tistrianum]
MKNKLILRVLLLVLAIQLTSCGKEKTTDVKEETSQKLMVSDTIFDSKNPYYIFIQKNNPEVLKENKLIYFKEEDIDFDGKKEAIVALGEIDKEDEMQTSVSDIFLLRNENGVIKKIDDFGSYGYTIYTVKLVSLQGKRQKYIYLGLTNGANLKGFSLQELENNKLKKICTSASATGVGNDDLVDENNDGKYDGYVQLRNGIDALYYEIDIHYIFKNGTFQQSRTHVEIPPEYPDTIEEILLQYISLRSLGFGESKEVNQRLKLICKDQNASSLKWNADAWAEGYFNSYMELDNRIQFQIQEDTYTTTATYTDENKKQYECQFELREYGNIWQIIKVTILKDDE